MDDAGEFSGWQLCDLDFALGLIGRFDGAANQDVVRGFVFAAVHQKRLTRVNFGANRGLQISDGSTNRAALVTRWPVERFANEHNRLRGDCLELQNDQCTRRSTRRGSPA